MAQSLNGTAVSASTSPSIFSSLHISGGLLTTVFVILLILYVYVWLHDVEMAKRVTSVIFRVGLVVVKGFAKVVVALVNGITNLVRRFLR